VGILGNPKKHSIFESASKVKGVAQLKTNVFGSLYLFNIALQDSMPGLICHSLPNLG